MWDPGDELVNLRKLLEKFANKFSNSFWRSTRSSPGSQIHSLGQPQSSPVQGGATVASCYLREGLIATAGLTGPTAAPFHAIGDKRPPPICYADTGLQCPAPSAWAASCVPTTAFLVSLASSEGWPTWQKIEFYSHLIEGNNFKTMHLQNNIIFTTINYIKKTGGYSQSVSVLTI